jgi:hypothetical protein
MPPSAQLGECGSHVIVAAYEFVVVGQLVLSISGDEFVELYDVRGIGLEHRAEGNADVGEPVGVRRCRTLALRARIPHRSKNETDRVDQCAVEIEQDGLWS